MLRKKMYNNLRFSLAKNSIYDRAKYKTRSAVESRGGQSLNFPDLADRVSDDLYSKRLSIAKALKELLIGNRAELSRWKGEVKKTLEAVIHD